MGTEKKANDASMRFEQQAAIASEALVRAEEAERAAREAEQRYLDAIKETKEQSTQLQEHEEALMDIGSKLSAMTDLLERQQTESELTRMGNRGNEVQTAPDDQRSVSIDGNTSDDDQCNTGQASITAKGSSNNDRGRWRKDLGKVFRHLIIEGINKKD